MRVSIIISFILYQIKNIWMRLIFETTLLNPLDSKKKNKNIKVLSPSKGKKREQNRALSHTKEFIELEV